jgi:hypothetical protein
MKIAKRLLITIPVLICAALLVGLIFWPRDRSESFYPSLAGAEKDGAIARGWIPEYLPKSSSTILELHEVSPSIEWCSFEFAVRDQQSLQKVLVHVGALPLSLKRVASPGKPWWPKVLEGHLDERKIHQAGFELYTITEPETTSTKRTTIYAIDWKAGRAFFYSSPDRFEIGSRN